MNVPTPQATWEFPTGHIGRRVLVYDALPSTNSLALSHAFDTADGTVILAQQQTAGRGSHGRVWISRPGSSLLMSAILKPPPELRRPALLTALAAVAVGDAIFRLTGLQARIKWPNDLLIHGKKVCGILIEQRQQNIDEACTVVGIGLNLNQSAEHFAESNLPDAASLSVFTGAAYDLRAATGILLGCLDLEYSRLLNGERVAVEADWKWRVGLLGRDVIVEKTDGSTVAGRLRDMGFDGLELEIDSPIPVQISPERVAHIYAVEKSGKS